MPSAPISANINSSNHIPSLYNSRAQSTLTGSSLFALLVLLRVCVRRAASRLSTNITDQQQQHPKPTRPSNEDDIPSTPPPPYQQHNPLPTTFAMSDKSYRNMIPPPPPIPGHHQPHYILASRLPPAPPLTPPELSNSIFSIDERLQQQHDNFMRQPNPDYAANLMADSRYDTDSEPEPKHEPEHRHCATPPTQPRRLLYNKTIPVGSPAQRPAAPSSYPGFFSAFRGSYPPANANTVSRGGPDGGLADGPREINVHGEIISMLDKNGTGWTRHTRVYGGGGCNTFPPTPEPSFYAPFPEETR